MAADGGGKGAPCMMEDRDGMGEGDGGKEMCVIGTPIDGGGGGKDDTFSAVAEGAAVGWIGCWNCGADK